MVNPSGVLILGAGWLGSAIGRVLESTPIPRRDAAGLPSLGARSLIVASGRSTIAGSADAEQAKRTELDHLKAVLDAADRDGARQVVVLGSSDICGMAPEITGRTAPQPRTLYAEVKAAVEEECKARAAAGAPVVHVRLAPVHGPGKARSKALVRSAGRRVLALPNGGRHSVGFIALPDAVAAILSLAERGGPPVVAVGAGETRMRTLLLAMSGHLGARPTVVPVPVPGRSLTRLIGSAGPDRVEWALRLSCPRSVVMEAAIDPKTTAEAARYLVSTCR